MKKENLKVENLALEFLEVASILERRLDRSLAGSRGISFSEYRMLRSLSNAPPAGMPKVDLASNVGLTPSAVTRALRPLEKLGYVSTTRSERDARQSLAALTRGGENLLKDAQSVMRDIFSGLPWQQQSEQKLSELQNRLDELRSSQR